MKKLNKEQYLKDLSKLVSFQTLTSNITENTKALDFIESKISSKSIIKRIKTGGRELLMASNTSTKKPDVCFLVHVDVVAGKPEQFSVKIKRNKIYGRGVSDMKFSIPLGYELLNNLIENQSDLSVSFVVTTDEETGGFQGAAYLADKYGFKPKVLIVPDGGDNLIFINKAKGVCALRIDSVGKPAHASRIWAGKNALEPLIKLTNEILKRYEDNNKKESMKTTVNIGLMQGGVSINQVCPQAFVTLDFRFPATTSFGVIFNEVKTLARKVDPTLKISICSKGDPTSVDIKNPAVKLFLDSFKKVIGRSIEIKPTYGASDARHFAKFNIPTLMIKPIGGDIHGDNENIDLDSCLDFYEAVLVFLKKLEQNKAVLSWHK
jgi:succinyl-diaminopimelate desuccinylase